MSAWRLARPGVAGKAGQIDGNISTDGHHRNDYILISSVKVSLIAKYLDLPLLEFRHVRLDWECTDQFKPIRTQ